MHSMQMWSHQMTVAVRMTDNEFLSWVICECES